MSFTAGLFTQARSFDSNSLTKDRLHWWGTSPRSLSTWCTWACIFSSLLSALFPATGAPSRRHQRRWIRGRGQVCGERAPGFRLVDGFECLRTTPRLATWSKASPTHQARAQSHWLQATARVSWNYQPLTCCPSTYSSTLLCQTRQSCHQL